MPRNLDPYLYVLLKVPRPQDYTCSDALTHILDAVQAWGGQLHPHDEFFDLFRTATGRIVSPDSVSRLRRPPDADTDK